MVKSTNISQSNHYDGCLVSTDRSFSASLCVAVVVIVDVYKNSKFYN